MEFDMTEARETVDTMGGSCQETDTVCDVLETLPVALDEIGRQAKHITELERELTTLRLSDVGYWKAEYDRIYHSFVLERKRNFVYFEILEKTKAISQVREILDARGLMGAWPPVVDGEVKRIKALEKAFLCAKISSFEDCDGTCFDDDCKCPDVEHFDECRGCELEKRARELLQKEVP